jgi:hypothetical protein
VIRPMNLIGLLVLGDDMSGVFPSGTGVSDPERHQRGQPSQARPRTA